jgi:hypothetical protein
MAELTDAAIDAALERGRMAQGLEPLAASAMQTCRCPACSQACSARKPIWRGWRAG